MHDRETILANIRKFTMLEIEGRELLKLVHDRQIADRRRFGRSRHGCKLMNQVALRIAQYGGLRAYWERQAKRFLAAKRLLASAANSTTQSHV